MKWVAHRIKVPVEKALNFLIFMCFGLFQRTVSASKTISGADQRGKRRVFRKKNDATVTTTAETRGMRRVARVRG